jgi:hypothetical protein
MIYTYTSIPLWQLYKPPGVFSSGRSLVLEGPGKGPFLSWKCMIEKKPDVINVSNVVMQTGKL